MTHSAIQNRIAADYRALAVRRRSYSAILWGVFVALMVAGFRLADARSAGGFRAGLPQVLDYPAELVGEAWAKAASLPGLMAGFVPALIETINIAAVSTILGAAGGAEAIFSVLALHHGIIPPTINLDNPGEGCDLDYVPNTAREKQIDIAVSNGFGFGGTNGTLVFRRL